MRSAPGTIVMGMAALLLAAATPTLAQQAGDEGRMQEQQGHMQQQGQMQGQQGHMEGMQGHMQEQHGQMEGSRGQMEGQTGQGPMLALHGGQLAVAGRYHFETVYAGDDLRLYVYTPNRIPQKAGALEGTVTVEYSDGTARTVDLTPAAAKEGETVVYYCPMHPQATSMEPGQCDLCGGMELMAQDFLHGKVDLSKAEPGRTELVVAVDGLGAKGETVSFTERYEPDQKAALDPQMMKSGRMAGQGAHSQAMRSGHMQSGQMQSGQMQSGHMRSGDAEPAGGQTQQKQPKKETDRTGGGGS